MKNLLKETLAYQPTGRVENPLNDMEMFQTPQVIRSVIESVNKHAYGNEAHDNYFHENDVLSVANLVMSDDEHIGSEFDKSQYWITINRIYRNENGRRCTRKRQVNWIACHSVICDDHIKVNVEKLFR